jgi:hypothetical protein
MDRDALLAELSEVAAALSDLPDDALEERFRLRQRQEQLRAMARDQLAETGDILSADEARLRLAHLTDRRDRYLDDTRLSHLAGAQTGQGGGVDPKYVHDMHRRMDESFDLEGINAEIERLHRLVVRLEGE